MLYKFSANTQLAIDLLGCHAKPEGVYPRLGLSIKITNPFDFALAFLNATGETSIQTPKGSVYLGVPYFVSTQTPFRETHIPAHHYTQAELMLDLDWRKLERIEEERHGDLSLTGYIYSLCACLEIGSVGADRPIESFMWVSGEIRRGNQSPIPIYQTEWIKILEALHYGKCRLLEVILPPPIEASKAVLDYIQAAEKAMWKGEYESVLVSCRKAIEEMNKLLKKGTINLEERLASESKANLVTQIWNKLKDFTNKGAHPGSTITRQDANFALLLTQDLVAYISHAAVSLPE